MAVIKKSDFVFTEFSMQQALSHFFGRSHKYIIPNVLMGACEADLVVISKSLYVHEVEIKISQSDIKKDLQTYCTAHKHPLTKFFSYAVPQDLKNCEFIPNDAGLIIVSNYGNCLTIRPPKINKNSRKLTEKEFIGILRLSNFRMWNLRDKFYNMQLKGQS